MTETVTNTTADPTIQFTSLTLGDKTYKLLYDFDAIATAEAVTGMSLLVGVDWSHIGVRQIRAMLYASAKKAHPDVTLDEFTPFITPVNITRIERALVDAWVKNTKQVEPENPPMPEPAPATAA
jgi:hypothetical protein